MSIICNLSQAIEEKVNTKVIINMNRKGYTSVQIAEIIERDYEEVEAIIKKGKSELG